MVRLCKGKKNVEEAGSGGQKCWQVVAQVGWRTESEEKWAARSASGLCTAAEPVLYALPNGNSEFGPST